MKTGITVLYCLFTFHQMLFVYFSRSRSRLIRHVLSLGIGLSWRSVGLPGVGWERVSCHRRIKGWRAGREVAARESMLKGELGERNTGGERPVAILECEG